MKNRKMWSFLMVIVMIFSAFLSQVGIASATSLTGSGTEESPYLIRTFEDLYQIESNITAHYKLANDIDGENFTKVAMPEFKGVLDGDGHKISNIKIVTADDRETGLFAYLDKATVKNLILEDINVNNTNQYNNSGILAATATSSNIDSIKVLNSKVKSNGNLVGFIGTASSSKIENSLMDNIEISGKDYVGAIVGNTNADVINCKVINSKVGGNSYVGGMVGETTSSINLSSVKNVTVTGGIKNIGGLGGYVDKITNSNAQNSDVTGTAIRVGALAGEACNVSDSYAIGGSVSGMSIAGGLVGRSTDIAVINSFSKCNVKTVNEIVGGLVGLAGTIYIENSFADNILEGTTQVGGLIGSGSICDIFNSYTRSTILCNEITGVGAGIVAVGSKLTIDNSYAANEINANTKAGFFSGLVNSTHSYFDSDLSGVNEPEDDARTTKQMKKKLNYNTWDFEKLWSIENDMGYPKLQYAAVSEPDPEIPEPAVSILKVILEPEEQLKLSIDEDIAENAKVDWTSSDSSIAAVDKNGVIKAITKGNTVITAKTSDGSYEEIIKVLVIANAKTYRLTIDLNVNEKCRLTIDDGKEIASGVWSVMDSSIATVTENGRITAVAKGLTIVTVIGEDGKEVGQVYIRVR